MTTKYIFFLLLLFATNATFSQVAINSSGSDAASSAMLDISSSNKGVLIPKMTINDISSTTSPVNAPLDGLLIYNTGSVDVDEGFYYWSGSRWNLMTNDLTSLTTTQLNQLYETAELYENNDFGSPTSIDLDLSSNYYGWISASEGEKFGATSTDITDPTADKIIVGEDGLYDIKLSISFGGSQNVQVRGVVFLTPSGGSAAPTRIQIVRKIGSTGDLGSATSHGLIRLNAGDALDVRFNATTNNERIDIYTANYIINKVGEL